MTKRIFDIVMAGSGLLLLAPVFFLIALLVKLDSGGPVFFRQERIGRHGRPFLIHKFRTMLHQSAGPQFTIEGDRRITRVGHWLRRSKLDELPQLIDVLLGSMSMVGPRPEVARYVAMYPAETRRKILSVRPGLTDPASIEFRREGEQLARAADPELEYIQNVMPKKLKLAEAYVDRASIAGDIRLILRTLRVLGRRR